MSVMFSGMRLLVSGMMLIMAVAVLTGMVRPQTVDLPTVALLLGAGTLTLAELLLIRAVGTVLEADDDVAPADDEPIDSGPVPTADNAPYVALGVAARIRRWPVWLRIPMALAYASAAAGTFVGAFCFDLLFANTFRWSTNTSVVAGFFFTLVVSYSANLALLAAMSAAGLPWAMVRAAFRMRLLIDAGVSFVTAALLAGR